MRYIHHIRSSQTITLNPGIKILADDEQCQITSLSAGKTNTERNVTHRGSLLGPTSCLLNSSTGDCDSTGAGGDSLE